MDLPKNIQDQADRARELQEEYIKSKEAKEEIDPAPGTQEDQAFKQDSAQVKDVDVSEEEEEEREDDTETEDTPPEEEPEEKKVDWEQKYRTLKGMYDKEIPNYVAEVRQLKQEIKNLQYRKEEPTPVPTKAQEDLDPSAYEDYGEDMMKLVRQIQVMKGHLDEVKQENQMLKQGVDKVNTSYQQVDYNSFLDRVKQAVPQFDEQDTDPEFLHWVDKMGIDLASIGKNRDVNRAIEVYKAYSNFSGKYQPKQEPASEPPPKKDVRNQVAPPKSRPTPVNEKGPKMWQRGEIEQAYKDIQAGKYSQEEAYKLKQQIFNAQREGRIT